MTIFWTHSIMLSALGSRLSALGSRLSALGSRLSALGKSQPHRVIHTQILQLVWTSGPQRILSFGQCSLVQTVRKNLKNVSDHCCLWENVYSF